MTPEPELCRQLGSELDFGPFGLAPMGGGRERRGKGGRLLFLFHVIQPHDEREEKTKFLLGPLL
jgi:hypothetical protein